MKQDKPLSYSALKQFDKSPNHLLAYWNRDLTPSSAMIKGRLIHTLVLEPDTFDERYAIFEGKVKRGKAYDAFLEENEGKDIISVKDHEEALEIRDKVWNDEISAKILSETQEVEIEFEQELYGVNMKGFVDGLGDDFCFDLKTTQSSEPSKFARDCFNYGYHLQAAIYLAATGKKKYYIISVESSAPFNVTVFRMTEDLLDEGFALLDRLLQKYKDWDGKEVGYTNVLEPLDVPAWFATKDKQLIDRF